MTMAVLIACLQIHGRQHSIRSAPKEVSENIVSRHLRQLGEVRGLMRIGFRGN